MNLEKTIADSMMRGEKVSLSDVVGFLKNLRSAQFATIVAETEPEMKKTNNPYFGRIKKITRYDALLNFQYDESIKRRLIKEGKSPDDFKKGSSWHEPILINGCLTPLSKHKTKDDLYIHFEMKSSDSEFFEVVDEHTRKPIKVELLRPYLKSSSKNTNQGLDKPLDFRVVKIENIRCLRANNRILSVA